MSEKRPIYLQMYTVRDAAEADLEGTIAHVAQVGYAGVELAGYCGASASEYKALLDKHGLSAIGAHVMLDAIEKDPEGVISDAKLFGYEYVIVPWATVGERGEDAPALIERLAAASKVMRAAGLSLGYHNHAHELVRTDSGAWALDTLFAGVPELVAEVDTFWVKKAGLDPAAYLGTLAGRVKLVHLKDMDASGEFAPVGAGEIDYVGSLVPAAIAAGAQYFIVEQDSCKAPLTSLESVRISFESLRRWGLA